MKARNTGEVLSNGTLGEGSSQGVAVLETNGKTTWLKGILRV
jgi:hypothetical protein